MEVNYPQLSYVNDVFPIINKIDSRTKRAFGVEMFLGLRTQTSSYFRNLYHLIDTIDRSNVDDKLKYELVKDIRVVLSSQEQVLLFLNSLSLFGVKWNYNHLIIKYKLCRNIGDLKNFAQIIDMEDEIYNLIDGCSFVDKKEEYKQKYFE